MGTILQYIGQFIAMAVGCIGDFLGFLNTGFFGSRDPGAMVIIIFVVCVPLVGLGIGLLRRLIHTRG